ncbi:MAG: hypothetical protein ACRDD1_00645, partial [Planctomycetia bacterium]
MTEPAPAADPSPAPAVRRGYEFAVGGGAAVAAVGMMLLAWYAPLGIPGEWTWHRLPFGPSPFDWLQSVAAVALLLAVAVGGLRVLRARSEGWAAALLPLLLVAGGFFQYAAWHLPPEPLGPERWAHSLTNPHASGYFTHARRIGDLDAFLRNYADWIKAQDSFHVGTHPPGLFLLWQGLLDFHGRRPELAKQIAEAAPVRFQNGLRQSAPPGRPWSTAQAAALTTGLFLHWVALLATALPIYVAARFGASPAHAWCAACLWTTVPAGLLFLPVGDVLFPLPTM